MCNVADDMMYFVADENDRINAKFPKPKPNLCGCPAPLCSYTSLQDEFKDVS